MSNLPDFPPELQEAQERVDRAERLQAFGEAEKALRRVESDLSLALVLLGAGSRHRRAILHVRRVLRAEVFGEPTT